MKPAPMPVRQPAPNADLVPAAVPGAAPAAASTAPQARSADDSLESCVMRNLQRYFADLDGSPPHALHEMVLRAVERPLIVFVLERCSGNQSAAAGLLGINRNTLRKKLLDYRIS
jgi:Fis family transcriptional regulator, factor for inversion stimulation protein